jgi:hypothetical protein
LDVKNIDFDSVDIGGERKTPMGTLCKQTKADEQSELV